jgi:hypothetical protein
MINAFHPKYIETHHPELIKETRTSSAKLVASTANGQKATRESLHGRRDLPSFPKTKTKK